MLKLLKFETLNKENKKMKETDETRRWVFGSIEAVQDDGALMGGRTRNDTVELIFSKERRDYRDTRHSMIFILSNFYKGLAAIKTDS